MPQRRLLIWLPVVLLCAAAAALGLRLGLAQVNLTETEVINAYADRYLADRTAAGTGVGAARTDCVAFPAAEADRGLWLIVSCGPSPFDPMRHYEYAVNPRGALVERRGPETWSRSPGEV